MATSPATLLLVSHDRRLLETVCQKLWVVDHGAAVSFDGGYRAWRAAVASGWTVAAALEVESARLRGGSHRTAIASHRVAATAVTSQRGKASTTAVPPPAPRTKKKEKLSKEAYRKQKLSVEADLTRLNLRKNHLELAMGDPAVAANFVEMRRVTSELADIEVVLATAEDAWLDLEERAP
jgi:ATPase subunit of ABC transporter with duplicated ATPase domains